MSNKLKTAILWGLAITFVFCTMSFITFLKGEDETTSEIARSFGAAFGAGLIAGILAYFFADKFGADKMFGKKSDQEKY